MILLLMLILIMIAFLFPSKKTKLIVFISTLLILIAGLKSNYSFDYENYLINFNEINTINDVISSGFEKLYVLMVFAFKKLGFGFNTFLLFVATLSIGLKMYTIKKTSPIPILSILIYFLLFYVFNDIEQIRNGLAVGICFYSVYIMLSEKKYSTQIAIILVLIATLIHYSAIVFLPVCLFKDMFYSKKVYLLILIVSFVFSQIDLVQFFEFLNNNFFHISYITNKLEHYSAVSIPIISPTLIVKVFIFVIFIKFAFNNKVKLHRILLNIYYYGIVITLLFNSLPIIVARGTLYMRYAELIMIPLCIISIKGKPNKKIHYLLLSIIFIYYFVNFLEIIMNPEYFNYASI